MVHNLEQGVAVPNYMGKGKATDYVVNRHECTSACLELGLPSRHCHPVKL